MKFVSTLSFRQQVAIVCCIAFIASSVHVSGSLFSSSSPDVISSLGAHTDPASEWSEIFSQQEIDQVFFLDSLNGFMVGESSTSSPGVFRSYDGGKYYAQCVTNNTANVRFISVSAMSTTSVVALTNSNSPATLVQHAYDGQNFVWSALPTAFSMDGLSALTKLKLIPEGCTSSSPSCEFAFIGQNSGITYVLTSLDGNTFVNSSIITTDPSITISGVTFPSTSTAMAWGSSSNQTTFIFRSINGNPWEVILANQTLLQISAVECGSDDFCFAAGTTIDNDCFIRRSTDSGVTWDEVFSINCMRYEGDGLWPFNILRVPTSTDIWASADINNPSPQPFLVHSTDGGNTWANATLSGTWHAIDMQFLPTSTGVNGFLQASAESDSLYVHSAPLASKPNDILSTE